MSNLKNLSEHEEIRDYEKRIDALSSLNYSDDDLNEWKIWAEKWADKS